MYYKKALEVDPEDGRSLFKFALFLEKIGAPVKAEEFYLKVHPLL